MGSVPILTVICQLKSNSSSLVWSCCRNVTLFRGQSSKLGLTFKTICHQGGTNNSTLITKIKETCKYTGELNVSDRILEINNVCITSYSECQVSEILENKDVFKYHLVVQSVILGADDKNIERMSSEYLLPKTKQNIPTTGSHGMISQGPVDRSRSSGSSKKLVKSSTSGLDGDHSVSPFEHSFKPAPAPGYKKSTEHTATTHAYHPLVDMDQLSSHQTGRGDISAAAAGAHVFCQSDVRPPGVPMPHQWNWAGHETSYYYNRTQSLPISGDEDIGLEEITCEVQSLPLQSGAANCLATPTPNSFYSQESVLGGSRLQEPGQLDLPVCRNPSCGVQHCVWHVAVLKYPQHVIWDPGTKTVTLERGTHNAYGFHYKIKVHEQPRETCMYALVDKMEPGMPAYSKLEIGDWIRSVNGHALQSVEADSININKSTSLRLVIQRPTGISKKAAAKIKAMSKNLRLLQIPQRPTTKPSPGLVRQPSATCPRASPGILSMTPKVAVSPLASVQGCKCCVQDIGPPVDGGTGYQLSSSPPSLDESVTDVMPVSRVNGLNVPQEVPVPKVRIFVCGNKSNVFANLLIMSASEEARIPLDSHVHYSRLCLRKSDLTRVTFDKWQLGLMESREESLTADSLHGKNGSQCTKCLSNFKQINADIFVISDENFFHHCSHFLFTKSSVFLIAFDAHKLLNQASAEISRIENILHTIWSFSGNSALVHLHGILSSDTVKADEVRTLFYTSHGKQLGRYAISIEDIIFLQKDEDLDVLDRLRSSIFDTVSLSCMRQTVSLQSLQLSEALSGKEGRTKCVWSSKELAVLLQSVYEKHFLQRSTAQDLIQLGDLVSVIVSSHSSGSDQYVIPVDILPRLAHLVLWAGVEITPNSLSPMVTDTWMKLLTTAILTHSELRLLLDRNITDSAMFITCLESLGIVFRICQPPSTSPADLTYLIPYFLVESHPAEPVTDESVHDLLVVFNTHVPWVTFFQVISGMSQHVNCSSVKMNGPCWCDTVLEGVSVTLLFVKTLNRLRILIQKGHVAAKEGAALDAMRWVLSSTLPSEADYVFGPACPLTETHRGGPTHALDMSCGADITCLGVPLDHNPTVRLWLSAGAAASQDHSSSGKGVSAVDGVESKLKQSLNSLPYSVLQTVILKLSVNNAWENVAAHLGKSQEEVELYATATAMNRSPAGELLKEWGRSSEGTIGNLLQILSDMERPDIHDHITKCLQ